MAAATEVRTPVRGETIGETPFGRLAVLEARKQVDTRAGGVLLFGGAALVLLVYVTGAVFGEQAPSFMDAVVIGVAPLGLLLPILAILGVTTEWSHGGVHISFILEPRRLRVLAAKVVGSLILAGALWCLALGAGAVATMAGGVIHGQTPDWSIDVWPFAGITILLAVTTLQGAAFGAALHNTAASIVAFLGLSTLMSILMGVIPVVEQVAAWLDLNSAMSPLMADQMTGVQALQLLTASALWIGAPMAVGAYRFQHREPS